MGKKKRKRRKKEGLKWIDGEDKKRVARYNLLLQYSQDMGYCEHRRISSSAYRSHSRYHPRRPSVSFCRCSQSCNPRTKYKAVAVDDCLKKSEQILEKLILVEKNLTQILLNMFNKKFY